MHGDSSISSRLLQASPTSGALHFVSLKYALMIFESMCSAFLWSGSPNNTSIVKIAWTDVCCLYEEGGLGLRRVQEVSTIFILTLIWRLSAHSHSLWGTSVRQYLLRGETLWDVRDTGLGS